MTPYLIGAGVVTIGVILWQWRRAMKKNWEFDGLRARMKKQKEMQDAGAEVDSSKSGVIDSLREDRF